TVLRTMRLQLGDVLVELRALVVRQDVAHLGDTGVEALLHLGAPGAEAGGVTGLATLTLGTLLGVRMVLLPRLALAGAEVGELLLLVGRERDALEEHPFGAATAATTEAALLLGALRTGGVVGADALCTGRRGQRDDERECRHQRRLVHVWCPLRMSDVSGAAGSPVTPASILREVIRFPVPARSARMHERHVGDPSVG